MLSRKFRSAPKNTLVYDPDRLPPEKPPALFTFRRESGWTKANPQCKCPVCEGTGYHWEDETSIHNEKCLTCHGKKYISEGELIKLYFDMQTKYRVDFVEWMHYKDTLKSIKRKLNHAEKVFLGLRMK